MGHDRPPLGWRLFAVLLIFLVGVGEVPQLAHLQWLSAYDTTRITLDSIALVGVVGYAWQRTVLPLQFWRLFALLFCFWSCGLAAYSATTIFTAISAASGSLALLGLSLALVPPFAIVIGVCVALLRHGRLIGPGREPLGAPRPVVAQLALPFN